MKKYHFLSSAFLGKLSFSKVNPNHVLSFLFFIWTITKLISFRLWFQLDRVFPRIPAFQFLDFKGFEILDLVLSISSFFLLVFSVFKPKPRLIAMLVILEILLCIFDLLRFQPFEFQLLVLSLVYIWKPKRFIFNLTLLLSATYIYAGLCKFNLGFVNIHWGYYFLEKSLSVPRAIAQIPMVKALGFSIPFLETLAGILLLTKYRNAACQGLILFHIATLLFLGPFHLNINQAVWPWNISMILLLWFLLKQPRLSITYSIFKPIGQKIYFIILFVFPLLGFTNFYHPYAAFRLYEGKVTYLVIQSASPTLAEFHQKNYHKLIPKVNHYTTLARTISLAEFQVPIAPVPWLHYRIREVIQQKVSFGEAEFYFLTYPYREVNIM